MNLLETDFGIKTVSPDFFPPLGKEIVSSGCLFFEGKSLLKLVQMKIDGCTCTGNKNFTSSDS